MSQETVMGIDPSLTGTAVVVLDRQGQCVSQRFSSDAARGLKSRFDRYDALCRAVVALVAEHKPSLVLVEGYSFGSRSAGHHETTEYGGLLRRSLLDAGCEVMEVPPALVKLFACGKGNGDKLAVATSLVESYGVRFATSDDFDAYALARMAACHLKWLQAGNEGQRRALASLARETGAKAKTKEARPCK